MSKSNNESSVTEKGQVTIPKFIRDKLGILPGNKVFFDLKDNSEIVLYKDPSLKAACKKWRGKYRSSFNSTEEFMKTIRDDNSD